MPCGNAAFLPALGPVCTIEESPHALTTLPSGSNSMAGGEAVDFSGLPATPSGDTRPPVWKPRVTMKTWSCESIQVPPTSPVTQLWGRGLGQNGSTLNVGAFGGSAFVGGLHKVPTIVNA